ncbi:cytochrome b561 and DOMON domain-containing protein At4g12980 [Oryza glaberrima]|uniref:cytochrome b561 and DOMON domain-containing protein At4g12980 n=1 Tax=Oryza glaberrima TaxID=4538 RepID=UPI00224C4575|nr:cytochrome b561 and DOMON domain-containing protein At4g12980 [Oryza glaberrima]
MSVLGVFLASLLLAAVAPARAAGGGCAAERFSSNRVYAACSDLPHLGASVHWTYDAAASASLSVAFVAAPPSPGGWVAWGLNPTDGGMAGTQALVALPKGGGGGYEVQTFDIEGYSLSAPGKLKYPATDLAAEVAADGRVSVFGKLALQNGTAEVNQVWQVGPVSSGSMVPHAMSSDNKAAMGKLNLLTGAATSSGGGGSNLRKKNTHGILNAVSWGLLLPMGAIFARYLKTFKSADPAWFYLHVACQLIGYGVGVSGWATGIHLGNLSKGITYSLHRNIGITVFALGTLQIFALFLRPKKDHKYRVYWNAYHHSVGYTIIILGIVNIFKGMSILNVEQKWKTGYIITISILGGIAVILEAVTWSIVLKRRKEENKSYNGASNGHLPLSM